MSPSNQNSWLGAVMIPLRALLSLLLLLLLFVTPLQAQSQSQGRRGDPAVTTKFSKICKIPPDAPLIAVAQANGNGDSDGMPSVNHHNDSTSEEVGRDASGETSFTIAEGQNNRQNNNPYDGRGYQQNQNNHPRLLLSFGSYLRRNQQQQQTTNTDNEIGGPADMTRVPSNASSSSTIFWVRECPCAPTIFCEMDFDTCGITSEDIINDIRNNNNNNNNNNDYDVYVKNHHGVGCFVQNQRQTLLRNAWPLLLLWYGALIFMFMCTDRGRHARLYIGYKVCGRTEMNERIVDRFLYMHGFMANNNNDDNNNNNNDNNNNNNLGINMNHLPIARPVEDREPTELHLKTRWYGSEAEEAQRKKNKRQLTKMQQGNNDIDNDNHNHHDNDPTDNIDNDDDHASVTSEQVETCTICFAPLQQGDRVGDLSCHHTFHVSCLREWLPRRNVCPLCQETNAATPRYDDDDDYVDTDNSFLENEEDSIRQQRQQQQQQQQQVPVEVEATVEMTTLSSSSADDDRRQQHHNNENENNQSRWRM